MQNECAILHLPETSYCFPIDEKSVVLRLRLDKRDKIDTIDILYNVKYDFHLSQKRQTMTTVYTDDLYIYYEETLHLDDARLAYIFALHMPEGIRYFSEDGLTDSYNFSLAYYNFFQLAYVNPADIHREVSWCRDAVFYQIFVDRFFQGDIEKDTSYINLTWGDLPKAKSFAGGDLKGIIQKLPYLQALGINGLYLTPVFASISNHKYDISDYYRVSKEFGTNADLKMLVAEAHKMGIRIMLDAVFNHCSDELPQFADVKQNGKASPYFDWFLIHGDAVSAEPLNYEVFGACTYMPKWNTSNKEVQAYLLDIALFYIKEYDIDGWRLDVSDEVSHSFWRKFREKVKECKPDCLIMGENWHDGSPYLMGDQFDGIMNYSFTKALLDYFAHKTFDAEKLMFRLNHLLMRNTHPVNRMNLNLLDCHDTHRFLSQADGNQSALISALALSFCFPGIPCIYYGTEVLLEGGYDPDCRRCMDWDEANWPTAHIAVMKRIIALKQREEIQQGSIRMYAENGLFYLCRTVGESTTVLVLNNTNEALPTGLSGEILVSHLYADEQQILSSDGFVVVAQQKAKTEEKG